MRSLRWAVSIYCLVQGTLVLEVPHRFVAPALFGLELHPLVWGLLFLFASVSMAALLLWPTSRPLVVGGHVFAGAVLLMLVPGLVASRVWSSVAIFLPLALGTAAAPLLQVPSEDAPWRERRDLLRPTLGLIALLLGLVILVGSSQFASATYDLVRPHFPVFGISLVLGGLGLLAARFYRVTPRPVNLVAHVLTGAAFVGWAIGVALPAGSPRVVVIYAAAGLAFGLLPWAAPLLDRLDPRSLRVQLAIALSIVAGVPLILTTAALGEAAERSNRVTQLRHEQSAAVEAASDIARYVAYHQAAVEALAAQPGLLAMSPEAQVAVLRAFGGHYPDVRAFQIRGRSGRTLARSDGRAPTDATTSAPVWFDAASRADGVLAEVVFSAGLQSSVLNIAAPIRDANGVFAGVAAAALDPARIVAQVERIAVLPGESIYVVDTTGRALIHSGAAPGTGDSLSSLLPIDAFLMSRGNAGFLTYAAPGGERMSGFARVPTLGWGVIVERSTSLALADVRADRDAVFSLLLSVLAAVAMLGVATAGRLASPIRALAQAAQSIAEQQRSPAARRLAIPQSGIAEVATLGASFADMQDALIARTAERERALAEERRAREHAQAAEARYHGLFHARVDAVIVTDAQSGFREVNEAAVRLLGYSHEELLQTWPEAIVVDPDGMLSDLGRLQREREWHGEVELRRKDGSVVPVEMSIRAIDLPTGRAHIQVMRDVSQRRALERMREELLGQVAHDLKSPVTTIRGYAQLVQRRLAGGELPEVSWLLERMSIIDRTTRRMVAVVDELLDVARLRTGQQLALHRTPMDLVAVVRHLVEAHQETTQRHRLVLEAATPQVIAEWDEVRIGRIVDNLLSNAIKYSPEGGTITIRVAEDTDLGGSVWAALSVSDQGVGIPPADRPYIFEYFRRGANVSGQVGGSGIGLATAKQIVEQHGGTISAASQEGVGSTFTVCLPVTPAMATPRATGTRWSEQRRGRGGGCV